MKKNCLQCTSEFEVSKDDLSFYQRKDIPAPEVCFYCRLRHLFAFWLFGKFRKAKSDLSGKPIITNLPETVPYPIYAREEWFSDEWDPMMYGRNYDLERPFFEQFKNLNAAVPRPHQQAIKAESCQWSDDIWRSKNCYLSRAVISGEDLNYCYRVFESKNSFNSVYCFEIDLCNEVIYCFKCYKLKYSFNSRDCVDSAFLYDCRNVSDCFMCWNLRGKKYCILNKQYSKEEYFEKLKQYNLKSYQEVENLKKEFWQIVAERAVHRADFNVKVVDSFGNFMTECKNCYECAFTERSENCRYTWRALDCKEFIDGIGVTGESSANVVLGDQVYDCLTVTHTSNSRYTSYSIFCVDCEYCFGCVGLRKKKYCIFNKQYSKEEYEELVGKIKEKMKKDGEWGRFFPMDLAGFGYNLSLGNIMFPESKETIEKLGGLWNELKDETRTGTPTSELPDSIDDANEEVTTKPLVCPRSKQIFNIAPHELQFYKKYEIPLPRHHFDIRMLDGFQVLAQATKPHKADCCFCKKQTIHFFPAEAEYKNIACIDCYQKEVV